LVHFQLKIEYELGYNNALQLKWKEALVHLENYLSGNTGEAFRAYCGFQVALAYHMLGDVRRVHIHTYIPTHTPRNVVAALGKLTCTTITRNLESKCQSKHEEITSMGAKGACIRRGMSLGYSGNNNPNNPNNCCH
jgi:hypothetical protein